MKSGPTDLGSRCLRHAVPTAGYPVSFVPALGHTSSGLPADVADDGAPFFGARIGMVPRPDHRPIRTLNTPLSCQSDNKPAMHRPGSQVVL